MSSAKYFRLVRVLNTLCTFALPLGFFISSVGSSVGSVAFAASAQLTEQLTESEQLFLQRALHTSAYETSLSHEPSLRHVSDSGTYAEFSISESSPETLLDQPPVDPQVTVDEDGCPFYSPPRQLRLIKTLPAQDPCLGEGTKLIALTDIQVLFLCKDGKSAGNFDLSLGRAGIDKRRRGDNRTPLGEYALGKPRRSDQFGTFIPVGYPTPLQTKAGLTGGDIGVHGPSRGFRCGGFLNVAVNWTQGCMAVASDSYIKIVTDFVNVNKVDRIKVLAPLNGDREPGPVEATPDPTSTPKPAQKPVPKSTAI